MGRDFLSTLAEAEALWKRDDHDGSWLAIEELPPIDRVMPDVIDLRLPGCLDRIAALVVEPLCLVVEHPVHEGGK